MTKIDELKKAISHLFHQADISSMHFVDYIKNLNNNPITKSNSSEETLKMLAIYNMYN